MDAVLALLADLVAIDSVNPSLVPGAAGEGDAARCYGAWLRRAAFDVSIADVRPGRPNVVAIAEGAAAGPTVLLCGHTDTVGVSGMDAPFAPRVEGGRMYGRGTQDMKAGLASMAGAAARFVSARPRFAGRLVVAGVIDEEYASAGAEALAADVRADAAVITEPTDLAVGVAHKGFSCAEIVVHGRAAHGSRPADGRDAILRMGRVLARLEALDRSLQARPRHALLGAPSLHASSIEGGGELSSYPARCVLQMERRTLPGEPADAAVRELTAILDAVRGEDPEVAGDVRFLLGRPAWSIDEDHPVPAGLLSAVAAAGHAPRAVGLSFWTDAAILAAAGTPVVLFGPGGSGLHGPEEHVRLDEVIACSNALAIWLDALLPAV